MDYKQMLQQMLDFKRSAFDKSFSAMVIWQNQVERVARSFQEQAAWLPGESQAVVDEWVDAYKKGRDEFRKTIAKNGHLAMMVGYYAYHHIRELKNTDPCVADSLTPREKECLLWIARGERNEQIAHRLNVTRPTIDFHLTNARKKLNARTRAQAIAIAVKRGLINP